MMDRWMLAYCPCDDSLVPGLDDDDIARLDVPILVFRSGASDMSHTRATSEALAAGPAGRRAGRAAVGRRRVERTSSCGRAGGVALRPLAPARPPARRLGRHGRIGTLRRSTMTTMTVQPVRDDLSFGARVGGITYDDLGDTGLRARAQRALRRARAADLRRRRADPEDAGGVQHRLRAAQGPPEQGGDPSRGRRPARRHRDAPRARPSRASVHGRRPSCSRSGCRGTSTTATTTSSTAPVCCARWRSHRTAA